MPKRSRKPSADPVLSAFATLQHLIEATETEAPPAEREKNPAAVALGRLGGLKGGHARANKLSKKRRVEIAKKAVTARWKKHKARNY